MSRSGAIEDTDTGIGRPLVARASLAGLATLVLVLAAGCFTPEPASIASHDPDRLIPAIKQAVNSGDHSAVPYLVQDLESDDSAIRMYAIDGLHRLTGQTLDYRYYDDEIDRRPAVARWKQWLAAQPVVAGQLPPPSPTSQPAPAQQRSSQR
jgi:hypothetical protein